MADTILSALYVLPYLTLNHPLRWVLSSSSWCQFYRSWMTHLGTLARPASARGRLCICTVLYFSVPCWPALWKGKSVTTALSSLHTHNFPSTYRTEPTLLLHKATKFRRAGIIPRLEPPFSLTQCWIRIRPKLWSLVEGKLLGAAHFVLLLAAGRTTLLSF